MAIAEEIVVQVRISEDTAQGRFSDALNFTQAEFQASTKASRRAMAEARRDAWLARVKPVERKQIRRELRAERLALAQEDVARAQRRAEIEAALDAPDTPEE